MTNKADIGWPQSEDIAAALASAKGHPCCGHDDSRHWPNGNCIDCSCSRQ